VVITGLSGPANRLWHSILSMPKASAAMSNPCLLTPGNFWDSWTNQMSTKSKVCLQPFQSTKRAPRTIRSTVGTVTEIYDYLRLLYARVGVPHCPVCGRRIAGQSVTQMVDQIMGWPESTKIIIMAPVIRDQKGEHKHLLEEASKSQATPRAIRWHNYGFVRSHAAQCRQKKKHSIDVVVDRISLWIRETGFAWRIRSKPRLILGNDSVVILKDEKEEILCRQILPVPKAT
jgi:excinuclease UvrABC ATPase subunit